jgi:hypothetical protein
MGGAVKVCAVDGCGRQLRANGMCSMHYKRMLVYGDLEAGCRVCGRNANTVHGGLCSDCEPTLCTCEEPRPAFPWMNDHECSSCRRLRREVSS